MVLWGGVAVAAQQVDWPEWRYLSYQVTATGPLTRLGLQVEGGLDHQLRFDDVSGFLVIVPEPSVGMLGFIGALVPWLMRFHGSHRSPRWLNECISAKGPESRSRDSL